METITHKGKVYQIGKLYRSLATSEAGYLDGLNGEGFTLYLCRSREGRYIAASKIATLDSESGTIEDAPIELEDGEWYMCSFDNDDQDVFYYDADRLCLAGNLRDNTRPLYKMVKAES